MVLCNLKFGLVAVLLFCGCARGYSDTPQTECNEKIYWEMSAMYLLHSAHTIVARDGCGFGMDGTQYMNYDTQVIQIQSRCQYYNNCSGNRVGNAGTWDRIEIEYGYSYIYQHTVMVNSNTITNITIVDTKPRISLTTYNSSDERYYINIYFTCVDTLCDYTTLWPEFTPSEQPSEGGRLHLFTITLSCFIGTLFLIIYFMYRFWQNRRRQRRMIAQLNVTDEPLLSPPTQQNLTRVTVSSPPNYTSVATEPSQTETVPIPAIAPAEILPPCYDDAIKFQRGSNVTETCT